VNTFARGFDGAVFDGRYVYFVPFGFTRVARYDITAPFGSTSSWESYDVGGSQFKGGVFDGRFVYLVPNSGSIVRRFDAKSPSWLPLGWNRSFL
jgi:hypothetical protein